MPMDECNIRNWFKLKLQVTGVSIFNVDPYEIINSSSELIPSSFEHGYE